MASYKVFQYKIPDQMRYSRTRYDHFENFRKIKFQWEGISEKPLAFCEFLLDSQSENGFDLTKDTRIEIGGSFWSRAYFCFSHCLTPPPTNNNGFLSIWSYLIRTLNHSSFDLLFSCSFKKLPRNVYTE